MKSDQQHPLRTLRLKRRMTQQELASASGVHFNTIHAIESGKNCTIDTLNKLSHALRCTVDDLIPSPTDINTPGKNGSSRRARGNVSDSAPKRRQSPKGKPTASSA